VGLSLGGSTGGSSSKTSSTSSSTSQPTYSGNQYSLQNLLAQALSSLVPSAASGGTSPQVQAVETGNANQINQTSAAGGTAINRFLASRGFGQSGQTGQAGLQTELARQAAQGNNLASGGGLQLQQNNTTLADALEFAYANPGSSNAGNASGTGSSSSWGFGAGAGFGVPGIPGISVPSGG